MNEYFLTTVDNPYNYFTQFDQWKAYDEAKGYYTCELVARLAKTSHESTDSENEEAIDQAIEDVLKLDFSHIYKKVYKNDIK